MIDGALPALDLSLLGVPAPAPAVDDPAAAELFATLVAQLLGQPAPAPAPAPAVPEVATPAAAAAVPTLAGAVPDMKGAVTAPVPAAPVPDAHVSLAPVPAAPELAVREPTPRAPSVAEEQLAHAESVGAQPAEPARRPVLRAPDVAEQRLPRAEPVAARPVEAAPPPGPAVVDVPAPEAPEAPKAPPLPPPVLLSPETAPAPAVDAPAAEAPAAPAPPVEVPVEAQVAAKVREVRLDEDGRHELTLDLHPAELGSVGVDVVVDGGTVHVAIRAEHAPAAELLRSSLDELRLLLTDSGLDVGDLTSRDGARHQPHDDRPGSRAQHADPVVETLLARPRATSADGVDVLL